MRVCTVDGCGKEHKAQGLCSGHYAAMRKTGKIQIVLPRRENDLCVTCSTNARMHKNSAYCRACASEAEKLRRRENADAINARRKESYDPVRSRLHKLKQYGLTKERYEEILARQGGLCAVCKSNEELHVDHDHRCCPTKLRCCGKCVRGLLCSNCNNGLGRFKDDVLVLGRAAAYLKESQHGSR